MKVRGDSDPCLLWIKVSNKIISVILADMYPCVEIAIYEWVWPFTCSNNLAHLHPLVSKCWTSCMYGPLTFFVNVPMQLVNSMNPERRQKQSSVFLTITIYRMCWYMDYLFSNSQFSTDHSPISCQFINFPYHTYIAVFGVWFWGGG